MSLAIVPYKKPRTRAYKPCARQKSTKRKSHPSGTRRREHLSDDDTDKESDELWDFVWANVESPEAKSKLPDASPPQSGPAATGKLPDASPKPSGSAASGKL